MYQYSYRIESTAQTSLQRAGKQTSKSGGNRLAVLGFDEGKNFKNGKTEM